MYGDFGHADQPGSGSYGPAVGSWTPSRGRDAASLRVSDADRDRAAAELSEHFQAGRLTQDEFDERVGKAINARTQGDLDELLVDLPAARPTAALPAAPAGRVARNVGWASPLVMLLASAVLVFAVAGTAPNSRGGYFPWWLIPLAFIAIRRLAWGNGRPPRGRPRTAGPRTADLATRRADNPPRR